MEEVICATKQEHEVMFRHNSDGPASSLFASPQEDPAFQRKAPGAAPYIIHNCQFVKLQKRDRVFHPGLE